ncbi:hypothetical protein TNCV_1641591 [Trichonephila clavipes]|nr:hypothetical protein TNCV_1641591 [Trichonephila clavipes]
MCEIQRAEITLVKLVQQMEFNSEIKDLSCKGMVNPQTTRGLLATDHVILNHGQVTWTTPELAPPLLTTTPHQRDGGLWKSRVKAVKYHLRRVMVGRPITAIAEPSLTEVSDNRDVLRHGATGPDPRASATMGASSRSRLSLNKIIIRIISTVKCYSWLYSPKNWEFWSLCQLATCDNRHLRTGLGLPSLLIQSKEGSQ